SEPHEPGRQDLLLLSRDAAKARQLGAPERAEGAESALDVQRGGYRLRVVHSVPEADLQAGAGGGRRGVWGVVSGGAGRHARRTDAGGVRGAACGVREGGEGETTPGR